MSMFGDNHKKNDLYDDVNHFFKEGGSIEEMMDVLHIVFEYGHTQVDVLEKRWNALKQKAIDYRFNKTGSQEDGRYCVAISVTDLIKWMEELENEN